MFVHILSLESINRIAIQKMMLKYLLERLVFMEISLEREREKHREIEEEKTPAMEKLSLTWTIESQRYFECKICYRKYRINHPHESLKPQPIETKNRFESKDF